MLGSWKEHNQVIFPCTQYLSPSTLFLIQPNKPNKLNKHLITYSFGFNISERVSPRMLKHNTVSASARPG
jgi:hypothetical protein